MGSNPTRQLVAPAGSNRSGGGGNEAVEAFDGKDRFSDPASKQAVTRVNAEQASKHLTWTPTRQLSGEGRRGGTLESDNPHRSTGVMAMACLREEINATQEAPAVAARDRQPDSREGRRPGRVG